MVKEVVHEDGSGYGLRVATEEYAPNSVLIQEYNPAGTTKEVKVNRDEVDLLIEALERVSYDE